MKTYVGVTDNRWYAQLAGRPDLNEINFWRPSGNTSFRALGIGEPFFFKTHSPSNRVVGGGFYSGFVRLRLSEAWERFDQANGVASITEMRELIGKYRRTPLTIDEDPVIGCIIIRDPVFFSADDWVEPPPAFAPNLVQGKGYDLEDPKNVDYFRSLTGRVLGSDTIRLDLAWSRSGPTYGNPRPVPQRLGQISFQLVVLDAYQGRCAVTGTKIRPVLQAAHIRPLSKGGEHRLDNGLSLRSDVHILFDRGYLGVDPQHRLLVSPRLRMDFGSGEEFYAKSGDIIGVPLRRADRPSKDYLQWHLDEVFLRR